MPLEELSLVPDSPYLGGSYPPASTEHLAAAISCNAWLLVLCRIDAEALVASSRTISLVLRRNYLCWNIARLMISCAKAAKTIIPKGQDFPTQGQDCTVVASCRYS